MTSHTSNKSLGFKIPTEEEYDKILNHRLNEWIKTLSNKKLVEKYKSYDYTHEFIIWDDFLECNDGIKRFAHEYYNY